MIEMNILRLCRERGIKHPVSTLMKAGISQGIVNKYLKGKAKRIPTDHIEKLCVLLRCTPNDLFSWTPRSPLMIFPKTPCRQSDKSRHSIWKKS